jgi:hypothetical protein
MRSLTDLAFAAPASVVPVAVSAVAVAADFASSGEITSPAVRPAEMSAGQSDTSPGVPR